MSSGILDILAPLLLADIVKDSGRYNVNGVHFSPMITSCGAGDRIMGSVNPLLGALCSSWKMSL
jgi:hypothetical protein